MLGIRILFYQNPRLHIGSVLQVVFNVLYSKEMSCDRLPASSIFEDDTFADTWNELSLIILLVAVCVDDSQMLHAPTITL